jgi:transketolase
MIKNTKNLAKIYSKLGQSGAAFGMGLMESQKNNPEVFVLSADMAKPAGLSRFMAKYPDMFFNMGIAEQNLIGVAAGMASEGKKVIATAQACFVSMRSCEQIRQYMGYMGSNVIAVGISSGFSLTYFGNTHYAIEDLSIMRSIPGMTILAPSDAGQAAKALVAAIMQDGPVYIRLGGTLNCPIVYDYDYDFEVGKSIMTVEQEMAEVTIFATGTMVHHACRAADILKEKDHLSVRVIDMHTVKPLDETAIDQVTDSALLVSIEEHNVIGGLGSAISEYISVSKQHAPLLRLGVQDLFSQPGDYEYLLKQNRLQPEEIADDVLKAYWNTK